MQTTARLARTTRANIQLVRLLQVKVLGDAFPSEDVMGLIRGLNVCQASERKYVNVSRRTPIVEELAARTGLPLLHFNLTKGEVKSIAGCTLAMLQGEKRETPHQRKGGKGTSWHHKWRLNTKVRFRKHNPFIGQGMYHSSIS